MYPKANNPPYDVSFSVVDFFLEKNALVLDFSLFLVSLVLFLLILPILSSSCCSSSSS
jgi:hypothetical protein